MLTALLAALALAQDRPVLLPEIPAGWGYERLEFPLSFAPALEHEGFEELAFAPGWSDPASDSNWSYALALQLAGDVDLDAEGLRSFLDVYFRGLCTAVGQDRQPPITLADFSVDVRRDGEGFAATVRMVDAFVTGKPLQLELLLTVHAAPRATELFGIASPKPPGAPIWSELRRLAEAWRAARPMPVFMNHVYVVPDAATYAAFAGSQELRELFPVWEERTTVRADLSYTGLYFYGERTYFELLKPGSTERFAPGGSGVGLGVERAGGADALAARLRERGIGAFAGDVTRALGEEQLPWFRMLGVERAGAASQLDLFCMEYDPRFLAGWRADLPPAGGGLARRDVLQRYAEALGQGARRPAAPFRDVVEVELALDAAERERWATLCAELGYEVEEAGETRTYHAPQVRFVERPSAGPGGVTAFTVALRSPLERAPLRLGAATLEFHGGTATLRF